MPLWTPSEVTTELWLDASDASTITESAGVVSQWDDKSGNNRDASQSISGSQPQVISADQNSLDVIRFDGSGDALDVVAFSQVSGQTIFLAGDTTNMGTSYKLFLSPTSLSSTPQIYFGGSGDDYKPLVLWSGNEVISASAIRREALFEWGFSTGSPASAYTRIDSGTPVSDTFTASTLSTWDLISARFTYYAGFDAFEIIILPPGADTDLIDTVNGYLAHKWGIEGLLPVGHPYKTTAPWAGLRGYIEDSGVLQQPSVVASIVPDALIEVATPLGAPSVLGGPTISWCAAPSMLGDVDIAIYNDFSAAINNLPAHYVMDLDTPGGTIRVPISSWQATLNVGDASYVQAVVPNAGDWVAEINAATDLTIYRSSTVDGLTVEYEMATTDVTLKIFSRGSLNYTCVLSGYPAGYEDPGVPDTVYDRTMTGVRSYTTGTSGQRARCEIDLLLRPGQRAYVDGTPIIASYINYYALGNDSYMDVGYRA